jgi:hypothetical protein
VFRTVKGTCVDSPPGSCAINTTHTKSLNTYVASQCYIHRITGSKRQQKSDIRQ